MRIRSVRAVLAALMLSSAAGTALGCGSSHGRGPASASQALRAGGATDPSPVTTATTGAAAPAQPSSSTAREVADPQEAESFPAPASVKHAAAASPAKAGEAIVAAGAPSDAEVRKELEQEHAVERAAQASQRAQQTAVPGGRSIGGTGALAIPANVPEVVQKVIAGANEIADFPYVFGGGHASFIDSAYDCSGSVSYALAAGGLLASPETSGELEHWGAAGPGRYITVLANAGHTYMYVDGVMYNTAGRSGVFASRWQVGSADNAGFVVRHWPGL